MPVLSTIFADVHSGYEWHATRMRGDGRTQTCTSKSNGQVQLRNEFDARVIKDGQRIRAGSASICCDAPMPMSAGASLKLLEDAEEDTLDRFRASLCGSGGLDEPLPMTFFARCLAFCIAATRVR